ncbi:MAG: Smr/MutS family protein [Oceanospirillaceae bacterium]|nr:Smr/MutS family protein [Oceanospirillaceae bacterium]
MRDKSDYISDLKAFREALSDVKPMAQKRAHTGQARRNDQSASYRREKAQEANELIVDGLSSSLSKEMGAEEKVLFALPGVQLKLLKRMQAGHLGWDAGVDLHGFSIDAAREELHSFVDEAKKRGLRGLLVVHGKAYTEPGKPALLKSYVTDWLQQIEGVLAFCSAQPQDGGTGALYVLLKRSREER